MKDAAPPKSFQYPTRGQQLEWEWDGETITGKVEVLDPGRVQFGVVCDRGFAWIMAMAADMPPGTFEVLNAPDGGGIND